MVWRLKFNIMWEWANDSRTRKYPLREFRIMVMAPTEAIMAYPFDTEIQQHDEMDKFRKYFLEEDNVVRSIVPHPLGLARAIPEDVLVNMYKLDGVKYRYKSEPMVTAEIEPLPSVELPVGVYMAYKLRNGNRPLEPGESVTVEYRGEICIAASEWKDAAGNESLSGLLSFPPSDVIGEEYKLRMVYPKIVAYENRSYAVSIIKSQSGCRFLYDPIETGVDAEVSGERLPAGFEAKSGERVAQIAWNDNLTDYHHVCMAWVASLERGGGKESGVGAVRP